MYAEDSSISIKISFDIQNQQLSALVSSLQATWSALEKALALVELNCPLMGEIDLSFRDGIERGLAWAEMAEDDDCFEAIYGLPGNLADTSELLQQVKTVMVTVFDRAEFVPEDLSQLVKAAASVRIQPQSQVLDNEIAFVSQPSPITAALPDQPPQSFHSYGFSSQLEAAATIYQLGAEGRPANYQGIALDHPEHATLFQGRVGALAKRKFVSRDPIYSGIREATFLLKKYGQANYRALPKKLETRLLIELSPDLPEKILAELQDRIDQQLLWFGLGACDGTIGSEDSSSVVAFVLQPIRASALIEKLFVELSIEGLRGIHFEPTSQT